MMTDDQRNKDYRWRCRGCKQIYTVRTNTVFDVQPSAFNGMLAYGEIVNHEVLVRIRPNSADSDFPAYVRNQLKEVEWRLNSLRSSMEHMNQQLEITLRDGAAASANDREQSEVRRQHRHSSATAEAGTRR